MNKKGNQAKRKFAVKGDEPELVELGQFLRESFPNIKVEREWYIIFNQDGTVYTSQAQPNRKIKHRHPDLMIFEKLEGNKRGKLLGCIELDGFIHELKIWKSLKRNQDYIDWNIKMEIVSKQRMDTSIFDEAYKACEKICKTE